MFVDIVWNTTSALFSMMATPLVVEHFVVGGRRVVGVWGDVLVLDMYMLSGVSLACASNELFHVVWYPRRLISGLPRGWGGGMLVE